MFALSLWLFVSAAQAQSVSALVCSPSTIGGGTGSASTCNVTLSEVAPTGGSVVTLASSLIELAASVPAITVPAGQKSMSFSVATNAEYRRYSKLAFSSTITATNSAAIACYHND